MSELRVLDNQLEEQAIDQALASCLPPTSDHWRPRLGDETWLALPPEHPTVQRLDAAIVTTTSPLYREPQPDHTYCGLHQLLAGGSVAPHRNHTTCRNKKYRRRLGIILFLNDPDGGEFELWDEHGVTDLVEPVRGRLVFFDATAFHGVREVSDGSRRLTFTTYLASRVFADESPGLPDVEWLERAAAPAAK